MREEGYGGIVTVLCGHCREAIRVVKPLPDAPLRYESSEMIAAEVWFSPPKNRGGVRFQNDDGDWEEARVTIYDSCDRCAAKAMGLIDQFYSNEREDAQPSQDHGRVDQRGDDLGCTCAVQQENQNEHDEEQHGQNHAGKGCTHGFDATPGEGVIG